MMSLYLTFDLRYSLNIQGVLLSFNTGYANAQISDLYYKVNRIYTFVN